MARTKGAKGDKWWTDAIRRVAAEPDENDPQKRKKLLNVANKLFEQALAGDVAAIKEIGDRLDGKPTQAVEGALDLTVAGVELTFVRPKGNPTDS